MAQKQIDNIFESINIIHDIYNVEELKNRRPGHRRKEMWMTGSPVGSNLGVPGLGTITTNLRAFGDPQGHKKRLNWNLTMMLKGIRRAHRILHVGTRME